MNKTLGICGLVITLSALLAGCERPPIIAVQGGPRGTAMEQIYNPRTLAKQASLNVVPESSPPVPVQADGPTAGKTYQNVKVLGDLSLGEFARTMVALTAWVSPQQGCNYCHVEGNFADESKYTYVVSRRMLQMTQHLNGEWQQHVASTGVTCYTCHRGNPVPQNVWYDPKKSRLDTAAMGGMPGMNQPAASVGLSSLPSDPFTDYLLNDKPIRVNGPVPMAGKGATANRHSTKQAEYTYGLMVHMSSSLGVNCTYCHNTQSFQDWSISPPQRTTAYYGIRMARDLNQSYLNAEPLTSVFPANRRGPNGDIAKVNCTTCHQGAFKPLYGAKMAQDYPAMLPSDKRKDPNAAAALPAAAASATPTANAPQAAAPKVGG
ncbi:MAG: photosynthetic reaction center cytochrome c subunit [Rhodoferax sp.]|nr:photosynthetic reaction center cytochrome c subunit [Rhodoferax sp.]